MSLFIVRDNEPRYSFDMSPEDYLLPLTLSAFLRNQQNRHREGHIVAKHDKKNAFEVNVDVKQFRPEEITVKVVDKSIIVEGKHEERQDEHGYVSRQFQRRYLLPEGCDIEKVTSSLSSDGVLTLSAPKFQSIESGERIIPVIHTGPHRKQVAEQKSTAEQNSITSE